MNHFTFSYCYINPLFIIISFNIYNFIICNSYIIKNTYQPISRFNISIFIYSHFQSKSILYFIMNSQHLIMRYLDCFLFILFFLCFSFYYFYLWVINIEYEWNGVYYSYQMLSFLYCNYFLYFYLLLYHCMECRNELIWNEVLLKWVSSL